MFNNILSSVNDFSVNIKTDFKPVSVTCGQMPGYFSTNFISYNCQLVYAFNIKTFSVQESGSEKFLRIPYITFMFRDPSHVST